MQASSPNAKLIAAPDVEDHYGILFFFLRGQWKTKLQKVGYSQNTKLEHHRLLGQF